jgi:hypothetical protein
MLTQGFFDDVQQNFIVPFFLNINQLFNFTINPIGFAGDIGILNVSGNLTNIYGNHISLDNDTSLIALHEGYFTFNLSKLVLDGSFGYEFITDPPIMADIGFLNLSMDNFSLVLNLTSMEEDGNTLFNLTYVQAHLDKFNVMIDGLNDFLWSMNGLVNSIFNLVLDQVRPIFEGSVEKLIPIINDLIRWIPDSIPIPGTLLHFDMALAKSPWSKEATFMELPLSISL